MLGTHVLMLMQVYRYLQRFMVCMSSSRSVKIIEELTESYNEEVLIWTNEIGKVNPFIFCAHLILYFEECQVIPIFSDIGPIKLGWL